MKLNITAFTRKVAVLDILRQNQATSVGASLLITSLMADWHRSGLRDDDLAEGLNEMFDDGSLIFLPNQLHTSVALDEPGWKWLVAGGDKRRLVEIELTMLKNARARLARRDVALPGTEPPPRWRNIERRAEQAALGLPGRAAVGSLANLGAMGRHFSVGAAA